MRKFLKSALVTSLLLVVSLGNAQSEKPLKSEEKIENSLLWEISGNGLAKPSYLYGTVHLICENDFIMKDKVKTAFEKTEELALELDFDDPKELQNMQKLVVSEIPLSQVLTKEEYTKLEALLKNGYSLDIKQFEHYNLIGIMSTLMIKQINCSPKVYEIEFLQMAMKRKNTIHGMETVQDQEKAFADSYNNTEFIHQLCIYDSKYFTQLIEFYKNEDVNKIFNMTVDDRFMDDEEQHFMLDARNKKWIQKMPEMMSQHSVFFAVGAAHLPGDNGVINLLKKAGYTVKSIEK
jgi:uncharacterized protein YbaP (TraB family)